MSAAAQHLVGAGQLDVKLPGVKQVPNPQNQFRPVDRLGQKFIGAEYQGAVPRDVPGVGGEDNHGEVAQALAYAP
jgi:hypothetical protein